MSLDQNRSTLLLHMFSNKHHHVRAALQPRFLTVENPPLHVPSGSAMMREPLPFLPSSSSGSKCASPRWQCGAGTAPRKSGGCEGRRPSLDRHRSRTTWKCRSNLLCISGGGSLRREHCLNRGQPTFQLVHAASVESPAGEERKRLVGAAPHP